MGKAARATSIPQPYSKCPALGLDLATMRRRFSAPLGGKAGLETIANGALNHNTETVAGFSSNSFVIKTWGTGQARLEILSSSK